MPEKETDNKVIMGIDPGTNLLGYSILTIVGRKPQITTLGVLDFRKCPDSYVKLGRIYERIDNIIKSFSPSEMAIESPFFGKNVQSMLKLGRAQGVAIAAAANNGIDIHEYAPRKIKIAITGQGAASKEQVAAMLKHIFNLREDATVPYLDATDALAAAYCHYIQTSLPFQRKAYSDWGDFIKKNALRIVNPYNATSEHTKHIQDDHTI